MCYKNGMSEDVSYGFHLSKAEINFKTHCYISEIPIYF